MKIFTKLAGLGNSLLFLISSHGIPFSLNGRIESSTERIESAEQVESDGGEMVNQSLGTRTGREDGTVCGRLIKKSERRSWSSNLFY